MTLAIVTLPAIAASAAPLPSRDITATFVGGDVGTGAFRMVLDDGSTSAVVADADAVRALGRLKAGDRIRVTCRDAPAGTAIAATAISILK